jgi:hypothetical protein
LNPLCVSRGMFQILSDSVRHTFGRPQELAWCNIYADGSKCAKKQPKKIWQWDQHAKDHGIV